MTIEDIKYNGWNRRELYRLLTEFEFVSSLKKMGLSSEEFSSDVAADETVNAATETTEAAENTEITASNTNIPEINITETVEITDLAAVSFKDGATVAFTIEDGIAYLCDGERIYKLTAIDDGQKSEIYRVLAEKQVPLALCDSKTALTEAATVCGGDVALNIKDDLMLGGYVINPASHSYDLDALCTVYLSESKSSSPADTTVQMLRITASIREKLAEIGQIKLYEDIEIPLAAVLSNMEREGFKVDTAGLKSFGDALNLLAEEYAQRIYMAAGHEFNINSPKQLGEVLFGELGLPSGKKTQTGYSTSADILEKLRGDYPIVDDILEYRSVTKLRSTYAVGLCEAADEGGRVHSTFNQTVTVTGRLSSTEPNLQNIPIRTEMGREMRRFFIPENGDRVLIDADYSQIELRLLAHIAGDQTMINGFKSGEDIHRITASQVFGVSMDRVTSELRKRAKAVNFGIVYGIGGYSLAMDIGVTKKEADQYIKSYFEKYPAISTYLTDIVDQAKRDGYVETVFGRRRYIPELTSSKAMLRAFGERVAMNSPIQGSSADIIKMAMVAVSKRLKEEGLDAKLILQVHDELIIESARSCADRAAEILKDTMENVVSLSVPLTVESSIGNSWFECK